MVRAYVPILILSALAVTGGCTRKDSETNASTVFGCSATATLLATSAATYRVSGLTVLVTGGTAPYEVTVPTLGTVSSSAGTFNYTGSFSISTNSTVIAVVDDSGEATSCAITSVTPSPTPTPTAGALTCSLELSAPSVYAGQRVYLRFVTSTGEPISLTSWDPGQDWDRAPLFPLTLTSGHWYWLNYGNPGTKSHVAYGTGATSGVACNGGAALTGAVIVY